MHLISPSVGAVRLTHSLDSDVILNLKLNDYDIQKEFRIKISSQYLDLAALGAGGQRICNQRPETPDDLRPNMSAGLVISLFQFLI